MHQKLRMCQRRHLTARGCKLRADFGIKRLRFWYFPAPEQEIEGINDVLDILHIISTIYVWAWTQANVPRGGMKLNYAVVSKVFILDFKACLLNMQSQNS